MKNEKQITDSQEEVYAAPEIRSFLHDLANPLTVVQLNLDILTSDISNKNKEEVDRIIKNALQGVRHANKMILTVRDLNKKTLKNQQYSACAEINKLVKIFESKFEDTGIELVLNLNADKMFNHSLMDFRRVFMNLIVNAVDALKVSKKISKVVSIASFLENKHFVIEVKDNGIGFNDKELHSLLLPGTTTKENGEGLGLWIIIEKVYETFSGKIKCSSEIGKGSRFGIYFPI